MRSRSTSGTPGPWSMTRISTLGAPSCASAIGPDDVRASAPICTVIVGMADIVSRTTSSRLRHCRFKARALLSMCDKSINLVTIRMRRSASICVAVAWRGTSSGVAVSPSDYSSRRVPTANGLRRSRETARNSPWRNSSARRNTSTRTVSSRRRISCLVKRRAVSSRSRNCPARLPVNTPITSKTKGVTTLPNAGNLNRERHFDKQELGCCQARHHARDRQPTTEVRPDRGDGQHVDHAVHGWVVRRRDDPCHRRDEGDDADRHNVRLCPRPRLYAYVT